MPGEPCARCGASNDEGSKFCASCGASTAAQIQCPTCNTLNELGRRFCTRCGGSLEHAGWGEPRDPGAVIDGAWERGGDEIIRRVDPEDARRFLGARTVRVPAGTVGVVLVDGVVERVLPPGERTSVSLFQRVASFFLGRERTAFYLVDQRPFPVPFVVKTRPSASGTELKTQVLVTFTLPKGDRDALAQFIANVVRERPSVSTAELYDLLRPDVVRVSQEVLERAAATGDVDYASAEAAIRVALSEAIARRYGLTADVTLAPMTAVATATLRLGTGAAPRTRACTKCKAELPASMRFCDRCGERQPVMVVAGGALDVRGLPADGSAAAGQRGVIDDRGLPADGSAAAGQRGEIDVTTPLFTSDGQQVELDVVVRASGQQDDFTPARLAPAVVSAAAAHLRERTFGQLVGAGGFAALEQGIAPAVAQALVASGMTLTALTVVDARSKTGQWVLSARADLERAAEDARLSLAWLEQRDDELDVAQLAITRALRDQQQRRDQRFAEDTAAIDDRARREALADRGAAMDVAKTGRDAQVVAARDGADHVRRSLEQARAQELRGSQVQAELAELRARRDLDLESVENKKRLELELSRIEEAQQLDKLRAMAALDRESAAAEHAHEMEKRAALRGLTPDEMVAMQAGELAKSQGGGAAWAAVLASRGETERRHAEEQRQVYDRAIGVIGDVAKSRAEAAAVIGVPIAAPVVSAPATGATGAPCKSCGAALKPGAAFCGACGASQPGA